MAELNRFTKQMQAMLPQWMKMAKDPESVGAQFLNVFGLEFQDVRNYLDSALGDQYIETIDLSQVDITYKVPVALPSILDMQELDSVVGKNGIESYHIKVVTTLREFYTSEDTEDVCIVDRAEALIYIRPRKELIDLDKFQPYQEVKINGATHYELILHHVWNSIDEFGLLLGLQRLYSERNAEYKERILDVFINPGNSTHLGLVNALSRELGITKENIIIEELNNMAYKESLLNVDGSPTLKLITYVDRINKLLGFTWDNMSWREAYWKSVDEANIGFDYLPHIWDASMAKWSSEEFQSGIGDGNDLFVRAPEEQSNIRDFNYYVGVRGVIKDGSMIYPEHSFKYKITAKGTILNQEYKPENYKYTVVASEIIYLYFIIKAYQKYTHIDNLDFSDLTDYKYDTPNSADSGIEVVSGTTILTNKADQHLEIEVYMSTEDATESPSLEVLQVLWADGSGAERTFTMDTPIDFDRNDPTVETQKLNVITGVIEVASLDITSAPTASENITVTLNGVPTNIVVDPATELTVNDVATKIRGTLFEGWVTSGTGKTIIFTADTYGNTEDASFSGGSTGVTGIMTTTTQGSSSVQLGFGDFYHVINTEGDWKKGSLLNVEITQDGSIQLIRPNIQGVDMSG